MHQQLMTAINEKRGYQANPIGETEGMEKIREANGMLSETIAK